MNSVTFTMESSYLGRSMEGRVYGSAGRPVLAFPTQSGRYTQFEDFGMVSVLADFIESGRMQLFVCDGLDWEDWKGGDQPLHDRILRHDQYASYIAEELIPYIHANGSSETVIAAGCSMGGYHASNMFFRRPDLFGGLISLSGWYTPRLFMGDHIEELVYFHAPLYFVSNMEDEHILNLYRRAAIVMCCGRGVGEEQRLDDLRSMAEVLADRHVPAWVDIWGQDVGHDWPWWRVQMPYFMQYVLKKLEESSPLTAR